MSAKFRSSISAVGIEDKKTRQAILALQENSNWLKRLVVDETRAIREELQRLKVYLSSNIAEEEKTE